MKVLAVSDVEVDMIYSPLITQRFKDVDLVIGCGDLPYYYLEYIISMLNRPLYYVRGNHAPRFKEEGTGGERTAPWGGIDLHRKVSRDSSGLLMAGIEGSVNYNNGRYQYSQSEMWGMIFLMVPRLLLNRIFFGRYLDIFVTHAPPWRIHDKEDLPHHGIKAFRWLIETFKPTYALHGHIHIYAQYDITETTHGSTRVINTYGYKTLTFDLHKGKPGIQPSPDGSGA
ncbi:MAG: metallophosphoesterase [Chloroflexi bacterium]|nr:MAG: metallophosphoesterase [Chloroflexota bacterium]